MLRSWSLLLEYRPFSYGGTGNAFVGIDYYLGLIGVNARCSALLSAPPWFNIFVLLQRLLFVRSFPLSLTSAVCHSRPWIVLDVADFDPKALVASIGP